MPELPKESNRTYRHNFICDWCWASKSVEFLNYANFSADAPWRGTICAKTDPSMSPWNKVFGYSRDRQLFDCHSAFFEYGMLFPRSILRNHLFNQSCALSDCRFPKHRCIFNWIALRYAPRPFGLSERCGGILPCGYAWVRTGRCFSKSLPWASALALTHGAFKGSHFELRSNEACLKDLLV